jgi:hypothetical protein
MLIAGAAVLTTVGVAQAQERPQNRAAIAADAAAVTPWHQRFTTSSGVTESITGETENDRLPAPAWEISRRWGVTVDVREAQRIEHLPEGGRGDQTSVGAFYQFTPGVRVGGALSLETTELPGAARTAEREPLAGVRIESAFRF